MPDQPSGSVMADLDPDSLPIASGIALGYCPVGQRAQLEAALALDQRLSQLVAKTSEPMLGQLRLAWWRETLQQPVAKRPQGDRVLDAIGQSWGEDSAALIGMVDGWEHLLDPEPLGEAKALAFAAGRGAALVIACGCGEGTGGFAKALTAARVWALADLAAGVSSPAERDLLVRLGLAAAETRARLDPPARPLAVLGALGARALARGGRPLMEGRGAAIQAAKAAILLR